MLESSRVGRGRRAKDKWGNEEAPFVDWEEVGEAAQGAFCLLSLGSRLVLCAAGLQSVEGYWNRFPLRLLEGIPCRPQ